MLLIAFNVVGFHFPVCLLLLFPSVSLFFAVVSTIT